MIRYLLYIFLFINFSALAQTTVDLQIIVKRISSINKSNDINLNANEIEAISNVRYELYQDISIQPWDKEEVEASRILRQMPKSYEKYQALVAIEKQTKLANQVKFLKTRMNDLNLTDAQAASIIHFNDALSQQILGGDFLSPEEEIQREISFMQSILDKDQYEIYVAEKSEEIDELKKSIYTITKDEREAVEREYENQVKYARKMRLYLLEYRSTLDINKSIDKNIIDSLKIKYQECIELWSNDMIRKKISYFGMTEVPKEEYYRELQMQLMTELPELSIFQEYNTDIDISKKLNDLIKSLQFNLTSAYNDFRYKVKLDMDMNLDLPIEEFIFTILLIENI